MTKKEQCYKIFDEHSGSSRAKVIDLVVEQVGITETTARTYYPTWRKEYVERFMGNAPKKEEIKIITEIDEEVKENAENIIKAVEELQKTVPIGNLDLSHIYKIEGGIIKEKAAIKVSQLIPITMGGKYGNYKFSEAGVQVNYFKVYLSKEELKESLEAIEMWEKHYGGKGGEVVEGSNI